MIKIILLLAFIVCYSDNKMIGKVQISYDMNDTNIDEASFLISKSIKSGSLVGGYELSIKHINNEFILNKANIFFKNSLGKMIIGRAKNRNNIVYELANKFDLIKEYDFLKIDREIEAISYIVPSIYDNVTEFDYSKKNDLKVFRSIWVKNNLQTSMFYIPKDLDDVLAVGLYNRSKIVDFSYTYEYIGDVRVIHSVGLIYKRGNYHYKSLYVFDDLDKDVFISGVDIFLLINGDDEAKVFFENAYGDEDIVKIGASFSF